MGEKQLQCGCAGSPAGEGGVGAAAECVARSVGVEGRAHGGGGDADGRGGGGGDEGGGGGEGGWVQLGPAWVDAMHTDAMHMRFDDTQYQYKFKMRFKSTTLPPPPPQPPVKRFKSEPSSLPVGHSVWAANANAGAIGPLQSRRAAGVFQASLVGEEGAEGWAGAPLPVLVRICSHLTIR